MYRSTRFSPCTFLILFKFKFSRISLCRKSDLKLDGLSKIFVHFYFKRSSKLRHRWPSSFMTVQFCDYQALRPSGIVNNNFNDRSVLWTSSFWPSSFVTIYFCGRPVSPPSNLWPSGFTSTLFSLFEIPVPYWTVHFTNDRPLWTRHCKKVILEHRTVHLILGRVI